MNPTDERILLEFDFCDGEIVEAITSATPPDGVTISKPQKIIKACAHTGGFFIQLAVYFKHDIHDVFIGILAAWLYDKLKKRNKKKCRINNQQTILSKRSILRLIKEQLANQDGRHAQYRADKNRKAKKSP